MSDLTSEQWEEYDRAAEWVAKWMQRINYEPLPPNLSFAVAREIREYPDEFSERVRLTAYALSMANSEDGE